MKSKELDFTVGTAYFDIGRGDYKAEYKRTCDIEKDEYYKKYRYVKNNTD